MSPQLVRTPAATTDTPRLAADDLFARSRFFLRQKHLSLSESYFVWGEDEAPLMFVERPILHARSILVILGAVVAFAIALVIAGIVVSMTLLALGAPPAVNSLGALMSTVIAFAAATVVATRLSAKRHVCFYRDETKRELLLKIEQDSRMQLATATYTVKDCAGNVLARLSKHFFRGAFRRCWRCDDARGRRVVALRTESSMTTLARGLLGAVGRVMPARFVLVCDGVELGSFERHLSSLDRSVLDLTDGVQHPLDRRVALAIAVMLDTGEKR